MTTTQQFDASELIEFGFGLLWNGGARSRQEILVRYPTNAEALEYAKAFQILLKQGGKGDVTTGMSIQLDGPATTQLLQGQIVGNPTLVVGANSAAQAGSYDRRASAARALSPGTVFG